MAGGLTNKRVITDRKRFKKVISIEPPHKIGLPTGQIDSKVLKDIRPGSYFEINGSRYYVLECDLHNFIMNDLKRRTQIVYPKDASYIIFKLDIAPGKRIGEAGTGSGALTSVFSRMVGRDGRVYTYEKRKDFIKVIKRNLAQVQEFDNVVLHNQSLEDGIEEKGLDAFFLDVREPWQVLKKVKLSLKGNGHLGLILPTTNQVSKTLEVLEKLNFYVSEVVEVLYREYKLIPERLRPDDTMVGHTGYLIFARNLID
ncbi:tRNA (adenine-N1)-methyltransferase [Halothermothrix orenii]|uniref:tRNA (adenine(58)-N(1))-methyltransferase TrmI n=1 Tax=Halothermothrix orenii (strain H 168 / OCM 544 / DSM 9562) TaxID=373903 RepID=B8CYK4_HALOH|nr:methyltransferase domain-containing protein [Halothermothrix orenii]ACL70373.1 tRNA methyltransferase complex GCD14 subunit [Halothermothrix orenii H 168]